MSELETPAGLDPSLERPRLRPLNARRIDHQGQAFVMLQDPAGVVAQSVLIPLDGYARFFRHFDGQSTLSEIQARALQETGQFVPMKDLLDLVRQLDEAMILDGPAFGLFLEQYRQGRQRPAAMAGRSYAGSLRALQAQLEQLFVGRNGSGAPAIEATPRPDGFRGILSPHIDFHRGGPVYTWSYRELVEKSPATTFVILGVAHQYCRRRFALTYKDFETPLGVARTDRAYVDALAAIAGRDLFDDELVHRTEHSIEFQVVFLQYLLGGRRDFSIVPILVGSFHDLMESGLDPIADPEVARFLSALHTVEASRGRSVAYIGGIDLCHVGPEFGDTHPVDPILQEQLRRFDREMLDRAASGDAVGWFRTAGAIGNRWRVCGLAATYTFLHAIGPAQGRLLRYDQAIDARRTCCVTFASMAFQASEPAMPPESAALGHVAPTS